MSTLITPAFRISYPNLWKPRKNELNGKDEYSCVALFPKGEDLTELIQLAQVAIVDMWGADKKKWPSNFRNPFRDQGEKTKQLDDGTSFLPEGLEEGAIFLNLKSQHKPGVVDQQVQPILNPAEIYAGCWCRASVNAFTYDQKGNRGVSFGLVNIQKVKDDDPLSGRSTPQDDFQPIGVAESLESGEKANPLSIFS